MRSFLVAAAVLLIAPLSGVEGDVGIHDPSTIVVDAGRFYVYGIVRPASPTKAPDADGFLQRWLILEPIRAPGPLTGERRAGGRQGGALSESVHGHPA